MRRAATPNADVRPRPASRPGARGKGAAAPSSSLLDESALTRAVRSLSRSDRKLASLIRKVGPCTLEPGRQPDHLTALVRTIVFQQLSGKAAATIFGRLVSQLPPGSLTADPGTWSGLTDEQMRAAGLSRPKVSYVRDLCEQAGRGALRLGEWGAMDDDEIMQALVGVRGFGRWSAHMILMFHLGRPDVWPVDDLGIRKALSRMDGLSELPTAKEIEARADDWRPWRSVAAWYLWRSLDVDMTGVGW